MKKILGLFIFFIIIILILIEFYIYNNPKIAVLCYHNIATNEEKQNFPDEADWIITVDNFEEHLKYLQKHNYKTLTMDEFLLWKNKELKLPKKSVLITFDDGFLSNYEYAFPLLKKYNMNATVFIVGSFVENSSETNWTGDVKTYISKDILTKIETDFPNINIYSHSYNLHYQGAINQTEDVLIEDIQNFEHFYNKTDIFCYPFGQYNSNIESALKKYDYKLAFKYGPNRLDYKKASLKDSNYEIPRLNVSHGMSILKFGLRLFLYY